MARSVALDKMMQNVHEELLFIPGSLNDTLFSVLVDSGATYSLISDSLVSQCNIRHLVDQRTSMSVYGVGHEITVGKIERAPLLIADIPVTIPFIVVKTELKHALLGVDFFTPYQVGNISISGQQSCSLSLIKCKIDLIGNQLIIGALRKTVPFLSGNDYPLKHGAIDLLEQAFGTTKVKCFKLNV